MLVDNHFFKIYELDSKQSIKERIAVTLKNELPRFVSFTYGVVEETREEDLKTRTISQTLEKYDIRFINEAFVECVELYSPLSDEQSGDAGRTLTIEEFSNQWYIHKIKIRKEKNPHEEYHFSEFLEKNRTNLGILKDNLEQYERKLAEEFKQLKKKVAESVILFKKFEQYKPVHSTNSETVRIKTELQFEVDYDIYELFNSLKMSRDIPFAVIGEYYKILKDFVPSDKWTYTRERQDGDFKDKQDVLFLKVLNLKNEPFKNFEKIDPNLYSTVTIYFESQQEEEKRLWEERQKKDERERKEREKQEKKKKEDEKKHVESKKIRRRKKVDEEQLNNNELERKLIEDEMPEKEIPQLLQIPKAPESGKIVVQEMKEDIPKNIISQINKVYMRIEGNVNANLDEQSFIQRVLASFPNKVYIQSNKQIQIKAEFLVPDFHLDRPIFMDLILNNNIFSKMCFVDERYRIQREKGGIYLYFTFDSEDSEDKYVTCSVTEQIVERTSLKVIAKDELLKPDTSYLRIRITKAADEIVAERFRRILMKLLSIYQEQRDNVIEKYAEYLDDFEEYVDELREDIEKKRKKSTRTKKMLKDVNPEQFISGYARLCQRKMAPKIIGDYNGDIMPEDVKRMQDEGYQVEVFPKNPAEGKQFYYACNNSKKYKYLGLMKNRLSNFEKYPLIPCCYKVDHRIKKKSLWREYYEEQKTFEEFRSNASIEDEEEDDEKHIYTTNKILPPNRMGHLAKDVDLYFKTIHIRPRFLRQGVTRSYNSVIESLLLALDPDFDGYNADEKSALINKSREDMLEDIYQSNIFQEAYNYTPEMVAVYLADKNKYLDPKLFIRMLEEQFKCYIYIFSQNTQYPYGILNAPNHVQQYLSMNKKRDRDVVFIYEHMGAELDRASYPQCELIIHVSSKNEKEYRFSHDSEVVRRTNEIFKEMYYSSIQDSKISIPFTNKIIAQGLDYYGKVRFLQFDSLCIMTDPLPAMALSQNFKYKAVKRKTAMEFLRSEKVSVYSEHIISKHLVGIKAKKKNTNFYISIRAEETDHKDNCKDLCSVPSFMYPTSEMTIYNNYHRTARYLVEYMLFLFSLDFKENKPDEINSDYIKEFVERNIEVDDSFVYNKVKRMFSMDSGLLRDGKLIVHNTNILKRLVYVLRLRLRHNVEEVKQYSKYKYIQNYYADIKDFEQTETQLILFGQHALMKWIENKKPVYELRDSIEASGVSLHNELMKYINEDEQHKLFVIIFTANWCRPCKSLMNRINDTRTSLESSKKNQELLKKFGDDVTFVYIDIDNNKGLASNYDVSSLPYMFFMRIQDDRLIELDKLKGVDNVNENIKLIKNKIESLLAQ